MTRPVDWRRVLTDIAASSGEAGAPLGTRGLARVLCVSRGTVRNVLDSGGQPRHDEGERWIAVWCTCTRQAPDKLPRTVRLVAEVVA